MPFLDSLTSASSWWNPGSSAEVPEELLYFPVGTVFLQAVNTETPITTTVEQTDIGTTSNTIPYVGYTNTTLNNTAISYVGGSDTGNLYSTNLTTPYTNTQNIQFTNHVGNNQTVNINMNAATTPGYAGYHGPSTLSSAELKFGSTVSYAYTYNTAYSASARMSNHTHNHTQVKGPTYSWIDSYKYQQLNVKLIKLTSIAKYGRPASIIMSTSSSVPGKTLKDVYPNMTGDYYVALNHSTVFADVPYNNTAQANSPKYLAGLKTESVNHGHVFFTTVRTAYRYTYSYSLVTGGQITGSHEHDATAEYKLTHTDDTIIWKAFVQEEYFKPFPGMIVLFDGNLGDLPPQWKVCNGSNNTPDLRSGVLCWNCENLYNNGSARNQSGYAYGKINISAPAGPSHAHNVISTSVYNNYNVLTFYNVNEALGHNSINYDHSHTNPASAVATAGSHYPAIRKSNFRYIQFQYPYE